MAGLLLWATILLPAITGLALLLAGRRADRLAGPLAILTAAGSALLAAVAWIDRPASAVRWLPSGEGGLDLALDAAGIAAPLAAIVAMTSLLVLIYAQGDIGRDEPRARFFGFMALFTGGMQLVVLADDLLTLLIGFELIGACSYALIGFWWRDPPRVLAANRAFVTTRTADLGLYAAAMAAYAGAGTLALDDLTNVPEPWRTVMVVGVITAAAGKSAQLPFSGWLSGAMLGPSPVSALLHSATMVAAGVVLLLKGLPLLESVGFALPLVLWLGVLTALGSGLIALYQEDLKQLTAASTVSQYGYMFAGVGAVGTASTTAYLADHAAFKALLFLISGALLRQGMKHLHEMGGLRRRLPASASLYLIGALSLAAVPPTGAFLTKESMLAAVEHEDVAAFALLLLASLLTAAYASRAWFGAFCGEPRSEVARTAHEPVFLMILPTVLLAVAALLLGALVLPPLKHWWPEALAARPLPPASIIGMILSVVAVVIGIGAIWILHRKRALVPMAPLLGDAASRSASQWLGLVHLLDRTGHRVIAAGQALDRLDRSEPATRVALGVLRTARRLATFDLAVVDGATGRASARGVLGTARRLGTFDTDAVDAATARASAIGTRALAGLSLLADRRLVDGAIALLDRGLMLAASDLSRIQTGLLYQYYAFLAAGMAALILYTFILFGI